MEEHVDAERPHKGWLYVEEGSTWKVKYYFIAEDQAGTRLCFADDEQAFPVEIGNLQHLSSITRSATTFTLRWPHKVLKLRAENDQATEAWLTELEKRAPKGRHGDSTVQYEPASYVTESLARFGDDGVSRYGQAGGTSSSFLVKATELQNSRAKGPTWMRDSAVTNCFECNKAFSLFNRKHHCRVCGRIFCDACSARRLEIKGHFKRVCDHCYQEQFSFTASSHTDAVWKQAGSVQMQMLPLYSHSEEQPPAEVCEDGVAELIAEKEQAQTAQNQVGGGVRSPRKSWPSSLGGGEWDQVRDRADSYADEPEGGGMEELGGWREEGAKEEHAARKRERGKLLAVATEHLDCLVNFLVVTEGLEKRWEHVIKSLVHVTSFFATSGLLPPEIASEKDRENASEKQSAGRRAETTPLKRFVPNQTVPNQLVGTEAKPLPGSGILFFSSALSRDSDLGSEQSTKVADFGSNQEGERGFGGGEIDEGMASTVSAAKLIESSLHSSVALGKGPGDVAHFGKQFKVKRLPGGELTQSLWVAGVAFSNQVVHKRMRQHIKSPRILLLGCAVEYERGSKFTPLANLAQQEREYLRIAVHRIIRQKPEVVFVEKSMAQEAKKQLREAGVSVVVEVKRSILHRISAATGLEIVASVELLGTQDFCQEILGGSFNVLPLIPRGKPLVCLDPGPRSRTPRPCTVILRGSRAPLDRAKAVMRGVLYAACAMHTEAVFLADLGCTLPPFYSLLCSGSTKIAVASSSTEETKRADASKDGDAEDANRSVESKEEGGEGSESTRQDGGSWEEGGGGVQSEESEEGDVSYRLLAMSPHVALRLPEAVCRELTRSEHKLRLSSLMRNLTEEPSPGSPTNAGVDGMAMEGGWTLVEEGRGLDSGVKPRQRLCRLTSDQIVQHAPRPGFVWGVPGQGVDCCSTDALRVLFTSRKGGPSGELLPGQEIWLGFNSDRHLTLMQFLQTHCFNPPSSGNPPDQEHFFVHAEGRVRVKVLRRSGASQSQNQRGGRGHPLDVWVRTRCLSCARTTNAGSSLGRGARHMSLGRFLLDLLYERRLKSMDDECEHPLHAQLIIFSQGSASAMFVHEPIPLCEAIPPSSTFQPLASDVEQRLVQIELQECWDGAEKLVQWAKQSCDGPARAMDALVELWKEIGNAQELANNLNNDDAEACSFKRPDALALKRRLLLLASDMLEGGGGAGPNTAASSTLNPAGVGAAGAAGAGAGAGAGGVAYPLPEVTIVADREADEIAVTYQHAELARVRRTSTESIASKSGGGAGEYCGSPTMTSTASTTAATNAPTPTSNIATERQSMVPAAGSLPEVTTKPLESKPGLVRANSMIVSSNTRSRKRIALRPPILEGSILYDAPGRCCFIIPQVARAGEDIPVYEGDPGSIIVMTLRSKAYLRALQRTAPMERADSPSEAAGGGMMVGAHFGETARALGVESSSNEKEIHHVRVEMDNVGPGNCMMVACKIYFAKQFEELREHYCRDCGGEDGLLQSLARCKDWRPTGGSTSVSYFKTADERFVLKEISQKEQRHFLQAAKEYFEYVSKTIDGSLDSCLAKILGLFRLTTRSHKGGPVTSRVLIFMENLLHRTETPDGGLLRVFDLKGSSRNRYIKEAKREDVQLDENFHAYVQQSPLYLSESAKNLLTACIHNDSVFLAKINVMDYSLLVGIDEECNVINFGIIDFIRQYTMDKQAESYYKMAIDRVAMKGVHEPTVIAPPEYRKRFQEAMARNFTHSPNTFALVRVEQASRIDTEGAGGITHNTVDWGVHDISGLFRSGTPESPVSSQAPSHSSQSATPSSSVPLTSTISGAEAGPERLVSADRVVSAASISTSLSSESSR